jgi:hypothetical protein
VTKLDKDFSSKLSTTQLLIPFTIIHHAQHGLMLECSRIVKCKDTSGGADKGEGPLGIQVQGDGTRNQASAGPHWHGTQRGTNRPSSLTRSHCREVLELLDLVQTIHPRRLPVRGYPRVRRGAIIVP